jgi:ABC-type branched-subunit amino acid transport system substrate-binding protein
LTRPGWDPEEPSKYHQRAAGFVRLAPPDTYQAWAAAEWAAEEGRSRVLVLHDGSTYSEGLAREFASRAPSAVATQVEVSTSGQQVQLPALVGYDAVYVAPSSVQSAVLLAQALDGSGLAVYASDVALDAQFLERAGRAAGTWRVISNGATPPAAELAGSFPDAPAEVIRYRPAFNAYVITRLVVEAVTSGRTARADVAAYVRGRTLPDGRPIFDEAGDPTVWALTGYAVSEDGSRFNQVRTFSN